MHNAHIAVIVLVLLCLFAIAGAAQADGPAINWWVFSGSGASTSAANITLNGSMGQTTVGRLASGVYTGSAGYWLEAQAEAKFGVYLPFVVKLSN